MKKEEKNTEMLITALENTETYDAFLEENAEALGLEKLKFALRKYIAQSELDIKDVIKISGMDRAYGYQLFNGTRNPSRDKIIQIAFAMNLELDECNHLLKCSGKQALYAKVKRDSTLIYAFINKLSLNQVDELLIKHDLLPLSK